MGAAQRPYMVIVMMYICICIMTLELITYIRTYVRTMFVQICTLMIVFVCCIYYVLLGIGDVCMYIRNLSVKVGDLEVMKISLATSMIESCIID